MARLEAVLVMATMVTYAAGFALPVFSLVTSRERPMRIGRGFAWAGFALHTLALLVRWWEAGHFPLATPYENAVTASWFVVLMTNAAPRRWSLFSVAGAGAIGLALVLLGWGAVTQDSSAGPMAASLKSVWLVVHVFFAFIAYGAFSVASGAGVAYLIKSRRGDVGILSRMPALAELDEISYRYVVFGFITCGVTIAAGSIWAKDLWGSYWSWDPVETWSLIAWLAYGILIHLRVTYGWRGRAFAWIAALAIVFVFIAYFGVPLLLDATSHVFTVPG